MNDNNEFNKFFLKLNPRKWYISEYSGCKIDGSVDEFSDKIEIAIYPVRPSYYFTKRLFTKLKNFFGFGPKSYFLNMIQNLVKKGDYKVYYMSEKYTVMTKFREPLFDKNYFNETIVENKKYYYAYLIKTKTVTK